MRHQTLIDQYGIARFADGVGPYGDRLLGELSEFALTHGLDHVVYFAWGFENTLPAILGITNSQWYERYTTEGLAERDPIIKRGPKASEPLRWSVLSDLTEDEREFMQIAKSYVGNDGVTVPIGGGRAEAGMSVAGRSLDDNFVEILPNLVWEATRVGTRLHEIVLTHRQARKGSQLVSELEAEYLALVADGLDAPAIAARVGKDERRVSKTLDNARSRLGAANNAHAVALAITHRILKV